MGVGFWFSRWGFADRQGGFQVQGFGFVGGSEKVVRGPLIVPKSLTFYLSTDPSVYLSIGRSIYLSICTLHVCAYIYINTHTYIYISIDRYRSIRIHVCPNPPQNPSETTELQRRNCSGCRRAARKALWRSPGSLYV